MAMNLLKTVVTIFILSLSANVMAGACEIEAVDKNTKLLRNFCRPCPRPS